MHSKQTPGEYAKAKAVRAIDEDAVRVCGRFPGRLLEVREARGLSRYALARTAGISREMVGRIEAGESIPTLFVLVKLARAMGVSLVELLGVLEARGGG